MTMTELKDLKILISGLDNAGKTSILRAFDKRYNFQKEIVELKPTIRIEYHHIKFLGRNIHFWDMGGQEKYRIAYLGKQDIYFNDASLIIYIIDIQDSSRYDLSLEYLDMILSYFEENQMNVPLIVAFHKLDPDLRNNEDIIKMVQKLTENIFKIEKLKMLFLQTSIYDIYSIVHLISSALSIFENKQAELKNLFQTYLKDLDGKSLILFDQNGIIISEYYTDSLDFSLYLELLKSIKEHVILLKKIQEESHEHEYNFNLIDNHILSYLHRIEFKNEIFFVSVLIDETEKKSLLDKFSDFLDDLKIVLDTMLS